MTLIKKGNKKVIIILTFLIIVLIIVLATRGLYGKLETLKILLELEGDPYLYYIQINEDGRVTLKAGYRSYLPVENSPPFLGETEFKYEMTLSKSDTFEIFSSANKVCQDLEFTKKPNNVHFEVPPSEVFILYKHYKINHYISCHETIPILEDFIELIKGKIKFVSVLHGGSWKLVK